MKRNLLNLILFWCLAFPSRNLLAEEAALPQLMLTPEDRILVIAPHPDDEVLGCAGVIQKAVEMKIPVRVVFLTNGDSNQWSFLVYRKHPVVMPGAVEKMGLVRHDEAIAAAKILGLPAPALTFLGYPDFGTINIWYSHWGSRPALRSLLTRAREVPYKSALRFAAPYKGEDIVEDIKTVLNDFKPTKIFVSHPADHNGDHLAAYLFLRVALWDLKMEKDVGVYPYLIHRQGWPLIKGFHVDKTLDPPSVLNDQISWRTHPLNPFEVQVKIAALKAHRSQYQSTPKYLLTFMRSNELFGDFPVIKLPVNTSVMMLPSSPAAPPGGGSGIIISSGLSHELIEFRKSNGTINSSFPFRNESSKRSIINAKFNKRRSSSIGTNRRAVGEEKKSKEIPEELTASERAAFVGVEWRFVRLEDDHLVVSVKLSRPLAEGVNASVYIFGYRFDRPFAQMPKLHVKLGVKHSAVYDQTTVLPKDMILVTRLPDEITIQVPLRALRDPQNILISARTYLGNVPLDSVSWRVLELSSGY